MPTPLCDLPDEALVFLMAAKSPTETVKRHISAFLTTCQRVRPLLNGSDLKAMGLKPGPRFRAILDKLLDARLNEEVKTESDERELVKRLTRNG